MSERDCEAYLSRVLRADLLASSAYHVPPAAGVIKLDAMENPYDWPEPLLAAWRERLETPGVNRYPDPGAAELQRLLRRFYDIPDSAGLMLGNGSDELIQLLAIAAHAAGGSLLAPEPSFSMYRIIAASLGMPYVGVPLRTPDFSLDADAMLAAIERHSPTLVFLASPNNPTGNRFRDEAVLAVAEAAPGLVVVDEAYAPFADGQLMRLCSERPNVLVLRTLSKMGLAGLRLGSLIGPRPWIGQLDKLRLPYNINTLTQTAAGVALSRPDLYLEQVEQIRLERQRLYGRLRQRSDVQVWPSETNFLLLRIPGRGGDAAAGLRERGVLIKSLHGSEAALKDCLRVTVGREDENNRFLGALDDLLATS